MTNVTTITTKRSAMLIVGRYLFGVGLILTVVGLVGVWALWPHGFDSPGLPAMTLPGLLAGAIGGILFVLGLLLWIGGAIEQRLIDRR
jgi:hypothetical protein